MPGQRSLPSSLLPRQPATETASTEAPLDRLWKNASSIALRPGALLFGPGMRVAYAYRLETGRVDVFRGRAGGSNAEPLYHAGAGDYLIEDAYKNRHDTSARCTTSGVIQCLPVARFHAFLRQDRALALALCRKLAEDIRDLRQACQRRDQHIIPLRDRVLGYVIEYADPLSGTLELPYALTHWARELGVAHETLSRTLRVLVDEKLLERPAPRTLVYRGSPPAGKNVYPVPMPSLV